MFDILVVGGGVVGLSTAYALLKRQPKLRLAVVEKDFALALHQSGRNSGVVHSGVYYPSESFKAKLSKEGGRKLEAFCRKHRLPWKKRGKLILAVTTKELPTLEVLAERARRLKLVHALLDDRGCSRVEPHARGIGGLYLPNVAVCSFSQVARALEREIQRKGGRIFLQEKALHLQKKGSVFQLRTKKQVFEAKHVIAAPGLYADRFLQASGFTRPFRILPFRGEFFTLKPSAARLVRGLIYPAPHPELPFLGVHLTRGVDEVVEAGPNAVLAFRREGYRKNGFSFRDTWDVLSYPGTWRLAAKYFATACEEWVSSFSKKKFLKRLQYLVPAVQENDLDEWRCGVRAQAVDAQGRLVQDFQWVEHEGAFFILNAPSPAATAALALGGLIARHILNRQLLPSSFS